VAGADFLRAGARARKVAVRRRTVQSDNMPAANIRAW